MIKTYKKGDVIYITIQEFIDYIEKYKPIRIYNDRRLNNFNFYYFDNDDITTYKTKKNDINMNDVSYETPKFLYELNIQLRKNKIIKLKSKC